LVFQDLIDFVELHFMNFLMNEIFFLPDSPQSAPFQDGFP